MHSSSRAISLIDGVLRVRRRVLDGLGRATIEEVGPMSAPLSHHQTEQWLGPSAFAMAWGLLWYAECVQYVYGIDGGLIGAYVVCAEHCLCDGAW